ncbi:hypothetical protein SAMN02982929_00899 [Saccharopolyspora kobensis]|uniref:Uncharacterized protein n=1 Tax=Saccharopolyspora kobensis TaxID=146035 RepID=A0A1H5VJA7_9PSEU|nr:hypothetical protein [Saccharopolyspora kobensis]SEF87389.1 hypothetical protein SAMN02982929_00899 [Saccharopolyspora kobensis]SFC60184.1 hypothetical protein SAMN05216506_1011171 [Saccharopolyspora kobensis]
MSTDQRVEKQVVVGLIVDPGISRSLASKVVSELPGALSGAAGEHIAWDVHMVTRKLTMDAGGRIPIEQYAGQWLAKEDHPSRTAPCCTTSRP